MIVSIATPARRQLYDKMSVVEAARDVASKIGRLPAVKDVDFSWQTPAPQSAALSDLQLIVRRRAKTILAPLLALLTLAGAYFIMVPPKFTATAVVLVDPRQQRVLPSEAVLQGIGPDTAAVESQVEILNSSTLARRVIDQLQLESDPEFKSSGLLSRVFGVAGNDAPTAERADTDGLESNKILSQFEKSIDVRRRGLSYILEVNYTSVSPTKAALIANTVADSYIADQLSAKRDATTGASDLLSGRIDGLRAAVKTSEQAVADFKSQNKIVDTGALGSGQTLNQRQIEEINTRLITAKARTAEASARVAQLKQAAREPRGAESLSETMSSRVLISLRAQSSSLASREAELATRFYERHPVLTAVRSQRADIERQMKEEIERVIKNTRVEEEVAHSTQASLEASLADLEVRNSHLASLRVRLTDLEREAEANRNFYAQFLGRTKETTEQKGLQKPDVTMVSRAFPPVRPSSPGKLLVLSLVSLVGLGLGLGHALMKESADTAYRTIGQLENDTGLACFGLVPRLPEDERADAPLRERLGAVLEALSSSSNKSFGKTLLVSSTHDGEGKTTLALALAALFAESGNRTLVVTDDPPEKSQPIDSVLDYQQASLMKCARTEIDRLARRGARLFSISPKNAKTLADQASFSRRVAGSISSLAPAFDVILLDGPALTVNRGQHVLFEAADSILLVVEWGQTKQAELHSALHGLRGGRNKVIGAMFNKVDEKRYELYEPGAISALSS